MRGVVLTLACLSVAAVAARRPAARSSPVGITVAARTLKPGELVVLTITTGPDVERIAVHALRRDVPAFRSGERQWRALFGIDLDQPPGASTITVEARSPSGVVTASQPLVIRPKRFPTRRLTVDPDYVNPPAAIRERTEKEAAFMASVYAHSAGEPLWSPPFVRPVPGAANSRFGTRSIFNGEPRSAHGGADFMSPAGTPIKAPNAGRIVAARALFFSGNTVVIDHGLGLFTLLAHLSRIDVAEGESVKAGQIVGLVGATGRVTGPHLHWSLRVGDARVDPTAALALLRGK